MLGARPASADWQFAPFFGFSFKGSTSLVDVENGAPRVHMAVGGTASWIGRGPIGAEGLFSLVPHFFDSDELSALTTSRTYAVMGNVVVAAPQSWNEYGLRPFVSAGLGLLHASQQTIPPQALPLNRSLFAYNVGGGAIGMLSEHTGVRFDLRYFSSLSRADETIAFGAVRLRYWTGAIGVVLRY